MATLAEIIEIKYGYSDGFEVADIGAGPYIAEWNLPDPEPTVEELQAWAADNVDLILEPMRQSLRTQADQTFARLAEIVTGEYIDHFKIQDWQRKEDLVRQWIFENKPEPALDNKYYLAYQEAMEDGAKTPTEMMLSWQTNAKIWRGLYDAFAVWKQGFWSQAKMAQDEATLESLRNTIEPAIKGIMGL